MSTDTNQTNIYVIKCNDVRNPLNHAIWVKLDVTEEGLALLGITDVVIGSGCEVDFVASFKLGQMALWRS